jgi:pimeloyl-ACP methyl ester carboxylesterase
MQTKLSGQNDHLTSGEKPVVVLLHGFAENGSIWDQQRDFLSDDFQIITPDLPGSEQISIEKMAAAVNDQLTAQGITKAVIIGHSMGGYVALALAEMAPSLIKGLGLFHSTAAPDSEEKKEGRRKSIQLIEQYGGEAFVKQALPNMFSSGFKVTHANDVAAYVQMGLTCPASAMIAWYKAMAERPDRTHILKSISAPVLFVIGKDDTAVPLQSVLPQVSMPAVSSIHIFEETGHMGMWEVPEASRQLLKAFILFCQ